ncbi:MAG TPA: flagellar type III secretion system pore protein FliP [Balneolaceae bacterium]|nr:flagellar type III secretion system pore protein FliP [Balneolaceae bacterium]
MRTKKVTERTGLSFAELSEAAYRKVPVKIIKSIGLLIFLSGFVLIIFPAESIAQSAAQAQTGVNINIGGDVEDFSVAIQALILLTVLSFGPAIVTMMTSFTRIIVVFFFLRMGLGTQQSPPNQVLLGLALFMTIFIMAPAFNEINTFAIEPYVEEEITQTEALARAALPLKEFMVNQTREKDLLMFMDLGNIDPVAGLDELPIYVVVPAFVISELRIAFQIGFLIYLPFMVIDLVVASILLSMGILFLPPVLVSLPFKILVFVLTDGWFLLVESMIRSFN